MNLLRENWYRIIGITALYFLLPAYISAMISMMSKRHGMFDRGTADNVFDFLADFMYPWRWKNISSREGNLI